MKKRLLSMLLCLCMLISLIPAIPIFAAGGGPVCDHSYTAVVTPPTCAAKGYTTYTCTKCGYTYIGNEVDTLDHKFDKNGVCTVCGRKALTARFACDEGASVVVYETQEFTGLHEDEAKAAYPRNAENGKIDFSGEGQVNFIVKLRPGYELESVAAAPADAFKDLKLPFETGVIDGYRLTKISGDLTVTVKVKKKTALDAFTVTFECDPGVSVTTYEKQSRSGAFEENAVRAVARDGATGEPDISGSGQVNFQVVVSPGYSFEGITLNPVNVFEKVRLPDNLGIENGFRIVGLTGNVTVKVSAIPIGPHECEHTYVSAVTAPTCTEPGYTAYTCSKCGESYTADETAPTGHSFCDQGFCTACGMLAHKIQFICDPGVWVSVSRAQGVGARVDENVSVAYPRSSETGLIVMDGSGQVIFTVHVENGFRLESVTPEPEGHFKSARPLAQPLITNKYRLTEITGDITVTVKSSVIDPDSCSHEYNAVVTPPTCVSEGFTTHTCGICGDSYKDSYQSKIAHDYQIGVCAACGEKRINVSIVCDPGASFTVYNTQKTDSLRWENVKVVHPYNAVTGLEDGSGAGQVYFTVRPAEGYQLFNISASPSDAFSRLKGPVDTGVENAYCLTGIRGECTVTVNVIKLGCDHSYVARVTAPTCSEAGYTSYTCTKCGASYTTDEKTALGHDYIAAVTAPTCTEKGDTTYTCSRCGHSYKSDEKAALGHDYEAAVTAPTCLQKGFTTYTCSRCGYKRVGNETPATGHEYKTVVKVPTCTEKGYTVHTCIKCGYSYTENETPVAGHDYRAAVTEPTCQGRGYTTYTCLICGDSYVADERPALGHDFKVTVTEPTCTERGYTTFACTRCRYGYAANETAALGHSYSAEVTAPTCTEKGCTTFTCTVCGDRYVGSETAALGHSYSAEVTAPTCTEKGRTTFTCTVCGDRYVGSETAALGHDYEAAVTAPTCTQGGFTTFTCTRCGDSYTGRETAALGHDWGEGVVTKQPLDTVPGVRTYTCSRCGEQKTEVIQPLSHVHKFVAEVIPPSCTEEGYTNHTCKCGDSYVDERVPALGHESTATVTAPTCTAKGCTTYTCSRCGKVYTGDETEALGHDYRAAVTAPTCTERGFTTYTCARCNDSYRSDEVDALGHAYEAAVTAPTCTEKGCTVFTCLRCGDRYAGDEIAALGHAYEAAATAPTCTERGFTAYTCSRCGDRYAGDEIAALGHDYEAVETAPTCTESGYTTYICTRCSDRYVGNETAAPGHDWDGGVVTKEPTEAEKGERLYTCTRCGEKRTETIPMLGHEHSYTAVVTAPTCTQTGYTTYTCTCGDSYRSDGIAALGHDYKAAVTAPTCTQTGHTAYACSRCGDSYIGNETDALGHDYLKAVTAPTCTERGFTTYTCSRCGDKYIGDETAAFGHDWDEGRVTIEPTDTEPGERVYTCSRCGEKRTERIPERNHIHAYTAAVTLPTCTAEGCTTHTCVCGDSYVDAVVPALGHDYRAVVTAPTCVEAGFTTCTCSRCGDMYICDGTAALGHDYRDGRCIRCQAKDPGDPSEVFYDDLFKAIEAADRIDLSKYSDESVEAFNRAFDAAKAAAAADKQADVDRAKDALEAAVRALEEKKPPADEPFRFDDVQDDTQYFYEPVYWAVENEITNGASATTFNPGAGCTRAQVVTFLWRAAGKPEPSEAEDPFADVNAGQYYYKAVLWAVENEITNGTGDGSFSPDATCTRGQIVTFLWRYFEKPEEAVDLNPFEDVMEGQYYTQAILWAVKNEITNGSSSDKFSPDSTCTRSQIVTFLYRAMPEETK